MSSSLYCELVREPTFQLGVPGGGLGLVGSYSLRPIGGPKWLTQIKGGVFWILGGVDI